MRVVTFVERILPMCLALGYVLFYLLPLFFKKHNSVFFFCALLSKTSPPNWGTCEHATSYGKGDFEEVTEFEPFNREVRGLERWLCS